MIKIAVDAMGGDHAPEVTIEGTLWALREYSEVKVLLTGPEGLLKQALNGRQVDFSRLEIVNAPQSVAMDEHPSKVIRSKPDSSIVRSAELVKEGQANAGLSAGNTGAAMASALFKIGRIKGVDRPAIGIPLPVGEKFFLLVDGGANADCKPANLMQFAKMGSIYAKEVLHVADPKVGLLNIGEEAEKGNELTKEAYKLLSELEGINFIGNIEGKDIPAGVADVVVCDGFVGNTVLKLIEGMWKQFAKSLKSQIFAGTAGKFAGLLVKGNLEEMKRSMDYAEYGGAPLLGVNGVYIISHGRSDAKAIKNAIRVAAEGVKSNFVGKLTQALTE
ncbi:MAG: phosphate acyltransferase PlsX [Firmicutes bacterium]|nr:phosphate acyltransferase PlsX [Bacillota bacterium]